MSLSKSKSVSLSESESESVFLGGHWMTNSIDESFCLWIKPAPGSTALLVRNLPVPLLLGHAIAPKYRHSAPFAARPRMAEPPDQTAALSGATGNF
jgi:hypothetical protein